MLKTKFELSEEESLQFDYFAFADRFGWTPDQVDNLSYDTYEYFSLIMEISREIAKNKQDSDQKLQDLKKGKGRS